MERNSTKINPKPLKTSTRRTSSRRKSERKSKREAKIDSKRVFRKNPEPRESQEFRIAIQECPKLLQK